MPHVQQFFGDDSRSAGKFSVQALRSARAWAASSNEIHGVGSGVIIDADSMKSPAIR